MKSKQVNTTVLARGSLQLNRRVRLFQGAKPCCLPLLILQKVPVLAYSNQELVDAHGGINGNFPPCRMCKKKKQSEEM